MIPYSITVAVTGILLGLTAVAGFIWAWRRGLFDDMPGQAHVPLEPRDYRLIRPWETPEEQEERRRQYGELIEPEPWEWGGPL